MTSGVYKRKSLEERFWSKVDKSGKCWIWKASCTKNGYAQFYFRCTNVHASRVAYLLYYGVDPGDLMVLHKCDNKRCVNPAHLFLGDENVNMKDWADKGLSHKGSKNSQAKLTEDSVHTIKAMLSRGMRQKEIASRFGVCRDTIHKIACNIYWKHVQ